MVQMIIMIWITHSYPALLKKIYIAKKNNKISKYMEFTGKAKRTNVC